ncbi:MAG: DUF934 domain-containing protein [Pseudomonadota bacterium]
MITLNIDGTSTEANRAIEISLEDWIASSDAPPANAALTLPNDVDLLSIEKDVSAFGTIILAFPKFTDGRAYSQARRLREQLGFKSEIIARGDLGRDQALFMARAGVTSFELEEGAAEGFLQALSTFSVFYQPAADGVAPAWRLRAKRAIAA